MVERELQEPVDLCLADGRLAPAAIGWSRTPLHRANLSGSWGRKKRWDYWCVTSPDFYVSMTYANIDYAGIVSVWVYQPSTGIEIEVSELVPLGRGLHLSDVADVGRVVANRNGLRFEIDETPDATLLSASWEDRSFGIMDVDLAVARPDGHESLNVVIPWSDRRFQFTSKQNTRSATGVVRIGAQEYALGGNDPAYGTLDLGRGIWPYSIRWNWAAASGTVGSNSSRNGSAQRLVGLQFGGKWTDGTGYTENALCVDGRLHKIGSELTWTYDWDRPMRPWQITDSEHDRIDLEFIPTHDRHSRTSLGLLSMEVHQCFGSWNGRITLDDGTQVDVSGLLGFAEEARNRW